MCRILPWFLVAVMTVILQGRMIFAFQTGGSTIDTSVDITFASQYIWKGYDIFDDDPAFQPSIEFHWREIYAGIWSSVPIKSEYEDLTEFDMYLGYAFSISQTADFQLDVDMGYAYFAYPKTNRDGDVQELTVSMALPNLIPFVASNLVPSMSVYYDWDGVQSSEKIDDGWFMSVGLGYDTPFCPFPGPLEEKAVSFSWDITYNSGVYGSKSGWSHTTVGVSTAFEWARFYFIPALHYQWSFEETVNDEDEFYMTLSLGPLF